MPRLPVRAQPMKNFTLPHRLVNNLCNRKQKSFDQIFFFSCAQARGHKTSTSISTSCFSINFNFENSLTPLPNHKNIQQVLRKINDERQRNNVDGGSGAATTTATYLKSLNTLNIVDRWHGR